MQLVSYNTLMLLWLPLQVEVTHTLHVRPGRSPLITTGREKPINQRNGERTDRERPQRSIGSEQSELDVPGSERGDKREQDSSRTRIRRRARIRDHEECKEEQRAAVQAVNRDRQWLTEPQRSTEHQGHVEPDERIGDITPARAVHDEAAEAGHQEPEECDVAPLSG